MHVTELALYEHKQHGGADVGADAGGSSDGGGGGGGTAPSSGLVELGNHDTGSRRRQMHRQRSKRETFTDALFWGGFEYFTGTWQRVAANESDDKGDGGNQAGSETGLGAQAEVVTYRLTLNRVKTRPSDPYSSKSFEEDRDCSLTMTTTAAAVAAAATTTTTNTGAADNEGAFEASQGDEEKSDGAHSSLSSCPSSAASKALIALSDLRGLQTKFQRLACVFGPPPLH